MVHIPAEERRRQIVEATVQVIISEGAARTTTRRVAAAANAPLASLHYTFRNKEDLFTAVIEQILDLVDERCRASVEPGGGLEAAVRTLFELNYEWCKSEPEFHIAEYELFIWALRTPSAEDFGRRIYERWFEVVGTILAESIDQADDPPPYLDAVTRGVVASLDGMILQIVALGEDGPSEESIGEFVEAALVSVPAERRAS